LLEALPTNYGQPGSNSTWMVSTGYRTLVITVKLYILLIY
jgi:hypothetical protein